MRLLTYLADVITVLRISFGLFLLGLGIFEGESSLPVAAWTTVAAWTSDIVDGPIARAFRRGSPSRLGKHDVHIDLFFSVCVLVYLLVTGFLPLWIAAIYLSIWGVAFGRWGFPSVLSELFQNPIYAWFLWVLFQQIPMAVVWIFLWMALSVLFFGRRLFFELLPKFLQDFSAMVGSKRKKGA